MSTGFLNSVQSYGQVVLIAGVVMVIDVTVRARRCVRGSASIWFRDDNDESERLVPDPCVG